MSATPPDPAGSLPNPSEPAAHDRDQPDATIQAAGAVSLRLMAGAVPKRTLEQLKRTVQQSPAEYPWQVVTQVVLAEPVDPQRLVQQGLAAQRDWILRGGRETPGPGLAHHTKSFFARLVAQLIFGLVYAVVIVVLLLLLKHKLPDFDIYRVLTWCQQTFGGKR
jgi:hypothetical protein